LSIIQAVLCRVTISYSKDTYHYVALVAVQFDNIKSEKHRHVRKTPLELTLVPFAEGSLRGNDAIV
jgi:hypothetical protein